jgi:glucose/arabinose dehydrogenase
MRRIPAILAIFGIFIPLAWAAEPFVIERMENPVGIDPQIGGIDVLPDGRVVAVFHRGEVMIYDPANSSWSQFAEGLHEPLGVLAESASSILVMQRPELTRLHDADGDGSAEFYETVFDGFGMTGNYHEYAFGPVKGPDGSLYIALNLASNGAGTRKELRGEWRSFSSLGREGMVHDDEWGKRAGKAGRMYSMTPYRGWILKLSSDGKTLQPFASGFRSPDGIGFDGGGNLLVTDNEGDWRGTSPLYTVREGGFYGHPASLVWKDGWSSGDPLKLPVEKLEVMRTPETARFPKGELANSPTQPVVFPKSWGPYAGQVLIGEMNQKRMIRYLADEVAGFRQGALVPMFDQSPLGNGSHRLAFGPDGTLWVGKTHLSWAGDEGLWKIRCPDAAAIFTSTACHLVKVDGGHALEIQFSKELAATSSVSVVESFSYQYHRAYGSKKVDEKSFTPQVRMMENGRGIRVEFPIREGFLHRVDLSAIGAADGSPLEGKVLYYEATRLP